MHLRVDAAPSADLERKKGLDVSSSVALRLLHASLSSLDPDPEEPREKYENFLNSLDMEVAQQLTLNKVIMFWRSALNVPPDETLMVVPLLDEANAAVGTFIDRPTREVSSRVHGSHTKVLLDLVRCVANICSLKLHYAL